MPNSQSGKETVISRFAGDNGGSMYNGVGELVPGKDHSLRKTPLPYIGSEGKRLEFEAVATGFRKKKQIERKRGQEKLDRIHAEF